MRGKRTSILLAVGALLATAGGATHAASGQPGVSNQRVNATQKTGKSGILTGSDCAGVAKAGAILSITKGGPAGALSIPGAIGGGFGEIAVTSINGNTIGGTALIGIPTTITVDSSTTYAEAGKSASLSDVHVGSNLLVCGAVDSGTLKATSVTIVLPRVNGVITAVNGANLTVTSFDGASRVVGTDGSTTVDRAGQTAAVSDLTVGTAITAEGNVQSDRSLLALRVDIVLPSVAGKVTAVNGNSITIDSGQADNPAPAIVTSAATTYGAKGSSTTTRASVTVGSFIIATGPETTGGATLNALSIMVLPSGASVQIGGDGGMSGQVTVGPVGGSGVSVAPLSLPNPSMMRANILANAGNGI
jgi:Domain of unknown function (DUF5666)